MIYIFYAICINDLCFCLHFFPTVLKKNEMANNAVGVCNCLFYSSGTYFKNGEFCQHLSKGLIHINTWPFIHSLFIVPVRDARKKAAQ